MKKILAMLLATVMVVGCFTGCGSDKKNDSSEVVSTEQSGSKEETPELDMSETVKMGILVSDATSAEALAFRTYYSPRLKAGHKQADFVHSLTKPCTELVFQQNLYLNVHYFS